MQARNVFQLANHAIYPFQIVKARADVRIEVAIGALGRTKWPVHVNTERFRAH